MAAKARVTVMMSNRSDRESSPRGEWREVPGSTPIPPSAMLFTASSWRWTWIVASEMEREPEAQRPRERLDCSAPARPHQVERSIVLGPSLGRYRFMFGPERDDRITSDPIHESTCSSRPTRSRTGSPSDAARDRPRARWVRCGSQFRVIADSCHHDVHPRAGSLQAFRRGSWPPLFPARRPPSGGVGHGAELRAFVYSLVRASTRFPCRGGRNGNSARPRGETRSR